MSQCKARWSFINDLGEVGCMYCVRDQEHQGAHTDCNGLWPLEPLLAQCDADPRISTGNGQEK